MPHSDNTYPFALILGRLWPPLLLESNKLRPAALVTLRDLLLQNGNGFVIFSLNFSGHFLVKINSLNNATEQPLSQHSSGERSDRGNKLRSNMKATSLTHHLQRRKQNVSM